LSDRILNILLISYNSFSYNTEDFNSLTIYYIINIEIIEDFKS